MADRSKTTLSLSLALIAALSGTAFAQSEEAKTEEATPAQSDNASDATPAPGVAGGHSQAAFIASYDGDGDGKVSLEELLVVRTMRFKGADHDGDGKLSEAEYVAEYAGRQLKQYIEQGRNPADERFAGGLKQAGVRFALLDRDRDGFLSLEEDHASAKKTFARNDTDGDGFVTAADPKPVREDDNNASDDNQGEKKDGEAN